MLHLVRRQIAGSLHQAVVFVLCVALSLVTLVSLCGFSRSVHTTFLKDARALHAADIIIHSHSPLSSPARKRAVGPFKAGAGSKRRAFEFYSEFLLAVRADGKKSEQPASLLSNLKVVEPGLPLLRHGCPRLRTAVPRGTDPGKHCRGTDAPGPSFAKTGRPAQNGERRVRDPGRGAAGAGPAGQFFFARTAHLHLQPVTSRPLTSWAKGAG